MRGGCRKHYVPWIPEFAYTMRASEVGPIARSKFITFVDSLSKTGSGKIMRRVLKTQVLGKKVGDLSTLEE